MKEKIEELVQNLILDCEINYNCFRGRIDNKNMISVNFTDRFNLLFNDELSKLLKPLRSNNEE